MTQSRTEPVVHGRIRLRPGQITSHAILVVLVLVSLYPFVFMLITSVKDIDQFYHSYFEPTFPFHFENYGEAWSQVSAYMVNSITVTAISVVLVLVFASLAGYVFARYTFPGSELVFTLVLLVMMVPNILSMLPVFVTLRNLKLLDTHLALIIVYVSQGQVLGVYIFRNFFISVQDELLDAAEIDGCGDLRTLWHVILPLSKPIIFTVAVMSTLAFWNEYIWPLIVLSTQSLWTITLGLVVFEARYAGMAAWGPLFSGYVIASIPLILLFAFAMKYFVAGLTAGAVKG
jgi:multiple sugar transport system permease protein/raffinose/stachyose/melibiose transport system permease protein